MTINQSEVRIFEHARTCYMVVVRKRCVYDYPLKLTFGRYALLFPVNNERLRYWSARASHLQPVLFASKSFSHELAYFILVRAYHRVNYRLPPRRCYTPIVFYWSYCVILSIWLQRTLHAAGAIGHFSPRENNTKETRGCLIDLEGNPTTWNPRTAVVKPSNQRNLQPDDIKIKSRCLRRWPTLRS